MAETLPGHCFILKQSTQFTRPFFFGTASQTVTVNISKSGGAFAPTTNAASEVGGAGNGNGWYQILLTTADTASGGILAYHATAASGGPADFADLVAPQVFTDLLLDGSGRAVITSNVKQGQPINNFPFTMTSLNTGNPITGLTGISAQRWSGGGFSACTNAPFEVGNGNYAINLSATDTNGAVILLRFTQASANDLNVVLPTQP